MNQSIDNPLLCSDCLCSPKFRGGNPNTQCDDLGRSLSQESGALLNEIAASKRRPHSAPYLLLPHEDTRSL